MDELKDILLKINAIDGGSVAEFYETNQDCFDKNRPDWLYPRIRIFFSKRKHDPQIDKLLNELGRNLSKQTKIDPLWEITRIDKSLCIDDSYVEDFILEEQRNESDKYRFQDIKSPYKTKGVSMAIKSVPAQVIKDLSFHYGPYEHPYILTELANCYILSGDFISALPFLYRSAKQIAVYPNKFWNSEYGLVGSANTFRHLVIMSKGLIENRTYSKLLKLDFLYLSRIIRVAKDSLFQQNAYVNRATIDLDPFTVYIMPLGFNPELLYISDMHYAHYCNELAEYYSFVSGWKYNMKSLSFYQHATLWPNSSGGYTDIEDISYNEIVEKKNKQADLIALDFLNELKSGSLMIEKKEMNILFQTIEKECRYNYASFKERVLQFKN